MTRFRKIFLCTLALTVIGSAFVWWHWFRTDSAWLAQQDDPIRRLSIVPDLSPQLTPDEVATASKHWQAVLQIIEFDPEITDRAELLEGTSIAWKLLASELNSATKVTLYSLHPGEDAGEVDDKLREELKTLPQFHGASVLGSITLEETGDVARWVPFLKDQVWSHQVLQCMFEPRHGFRFSTPRGEVDLVLCFKCHGIIIDDRTKSRLIRKAKAKPLREGAKVGHWPMLTPLVRDVVNALFDKKGIRRDRERPRHE